MSENLKNRRSHGKILFGPHKQYIDYCVHTSHAAAFLWRALEIQQGLALDTR